MSVLRTMKTTAAVLDEVGGEFSIREVDLQHPLPEEVLVEIRGVGICHTDLAVKQGHLPFRFPGVLGHEGSGIVKAVGDNVQGFEVGDRVCLSFSNCGECRQCTAGEPSYCTQFRACNFQGTRLDGTTAISQDGEPLGGHFFGQSSFSRHAVANQRSVVKVPEGVPLELAGSLGCGIQTGAGAVMNALQVGPGASLLITGGGSVGLAAVMAAAVQGVGTIIVAEPVARRRELAMQLGATHAFDPKAAPLSEQVKTVIAIGVDYAIDTTARPVVIAEVVASMAHRGTVGLLGVPTNPDQTLDARLLQMNSQGLTFTGICEGNSDRVTFIPRLMDLYLAGNFPFDELVTRVPFAEIERGIELQEQGEAVKVVLTIASDESFGPRETKRMVTA